ncbi:FAD-dependent oxidoreductase [Methylobacterium indicum]|uniref:FAD-dependent oxidoreductase n=1 Tax=Methylobacterium indicum TaxID=1775910 RepID=UPI0009E3A288|nr:FAD-dependent oxidoreductase [Methylobacterium indicum]
MSRKIAIIGGGWYGCHIASSLMALGFSVRLFEQNDRLLHEASGNNQFRLHLGFHYPRHATTRIQSRDGFSRFLERYGDLSRPIEENIYAVPRRTSLLDFDTYKLIMTATGISYKTVDQCGADLREIEGMILAEERVILIEKARHYFSAHLRQALSLSVRIESVEQTDRHVLVNGERFDYMVDATWGHFTPVPIQTFFEPTLLLYFEAAPNLPAVTFVDGPLYSIYPTEEPRVYTLSSVPHTPLGRYSSSAEACAARDSVNSDLIRSKLELMVNQACENVTYFHDQYRFLGPQIAIKTKPIGGSDDRSCYVGRQGRIFSVMSGKIDTIFFATERILSMMEADSDGPSQDIPSSLLANIRAKTVQIGMDIGG